MAIKEQRLSTASFKSRLLSEKLTLRKASSDSSKLNQSLGRAAVDLNPHQIEASIFAFKSPLSRGAILADEVGLGKTIEAGLIINQLWCEGKRKILILCPASIRKQWESELLAHFDLPSRIIDGQTFNVLASAGRKNPLNEDGIFIASLDFGYRKAVEIKSTYWDLVVIDEAHRLRNAWRAENKVARRIREAVSGPNIKGKVLLTATPLQNNLMELFGLVSFIDEQALGTNYSFKRKFISPDEQELVYNLEELRDRLIGRINPKTGHVTGGIITRSLRRQVREYVPYTARTGITVDFEPNDDEWQLYEFVSDYLARDDILAVETKQRALMILIYRKILASSSFAIAATLKSLIAQLERKLSLIRAGQRLKQTITIPEDIKQDIDDAYIEEIEEVEDTEEIEDSQDIEQQETSRLGENKTIQEEITEKALMAEIAELERYYNLAIKISKNAKGEALVRALNSIFAEAEKKDWPQKVVIFTESRRTQNYLYDLLSANGYEGQIVLFNGSNDNKEASRAYSEWAREFPELAKSGNRSTNIRQALVHDFQTNKKVFIATEAGAEGLNLQFCNIVVNYDLPWNPQRIEQRIGRCHRYGQRFDVLVVNFVNRKNAADERLYDLLSKKLKLFDGLFGSSDEILGALGSGIDFEKRILEIYQTCREPEDIQRAFDELQKELEAQINDRLLQTRQLVMEHYDDEVRNKLKLRDEQLRVELSEIDKALKTIVLETLDDHLEKTDDENVYLVKALPFDQQIRTGDSIVGKKVSFRPLEQSERDQGIVRLHLYHPLVEDIIKSIKKDKISKVYSLTFEYTSGGHRISMLNDFCGCSGYLFVYKITFNGIETIEYLLPVAVVGFGSQWLPLTAEQAEKLLTVTLTENGFVSTVERQAFEVLQNTYRQEKETLSNQLKIINEEYYDQERERLDLYTEESLMELEDKVDRKKREWNEAKRKLSRANTHEERMQLRDTVYKLEKEYRKLLSKRDQENLRSFEEKDKKLKELENKLKFNLEEELILKAAFRIL
ncbi:MAG: SNF2-related protein [Actinomycetota bacterium]